jgi:hypothetical protein
VPQNPHEHEDREKTKANTEPGMWGKQNFLAKCIAVLLVLEVKNDRICVRNTNLVNLIIILNMCTHMFGVDDYTLVYAGLL